MKSIFTLLLVIMTIILIGCKQNCFDNKSVMYISFKDDILYIIVSERKGYDKAPLGSSSHAFVLTSLKLKMITFNFKEAEIDNMIKEEKTTIIFSEEGDNVKRKTVSWLVNNKGIPKAIQMRNIEDYSNISDLQKKFPQWMPFYPDPLLSAVKIGQKKYYITEIKNITHVFTEDGKFHRTLNKRINFSTIYDPDSHRIIIINENSNSSKGGYLPESVTIWDFLSDKKTTYKLLESTEFLSLNLQYFCQLS